VILGACASLGEPDERWANYQPWTKITEGRVITGNPIGLTAEVHMSTKGYREVFVNEVGRETMQGSAPYNYPAGTVIVKEQYKNKAAWEAQSSPQLTIMVKIADSDNPQAENWIWATGYQESAGANAFCSGCHTAAVRSDFAFTNEDFFNKSN